MLYRIAHSVLLPLARLIYRPVVEGVDNVPATGPVILASNHLSFIDSVVIPLLAPRRVRFLAKAEYFRGRGIKGRLSRWWFTSIGSVPVERGSHGAAQAALDAALSVLEDGDVFGIYPEGTRSLDGRLYRGKTGVGWLALTAKAPVVPVALIGTQRIMPVGTKVPRVHPVTIRFGAPLEFADRHGMAGVAKARRSVTDEVMQAIQALSSQELANTYNESPQSS